MFYLYIFFYLRWNLKFKNDQRKDQMMATLTLRMNTIIQQVNTLSPVYTVDLMDSALLWLLLWLQLEMALLQRQFLHWELLQWLEMDSVWLWLIIWEQRVMTSIWSKKNTGKGNKLNRIYKRKNQKWYNSTKKWIYNLPLQRKLLI